MLHVRCGDDIVGKLQAGGERASRSEQLALEAVAAGAASPARAFVAVHDREKAPWLGDVMFYAIIANLAAAPVPLLEGGAAWPGGGWEGCD